jgi:hypothetical protein
MPDSESSLPTVLDELASLGQQDRREVVATLDVPVLKVAAVPPVAAVSAAALHRGEENPAWLAECVAVAAVSAAAPAPQSVLS